MHLPARSPPLRGLLLILVSNLTRFTWIRRLVLAKVRKDSRITELPELP